MYVHIRKNTMTPSTIEMNCVMTLPGIAVDITARLRVDRKNAIVSISNPFRLIALRTKKYTHISIVMPTNATVMLCVYLSPIPSMSCTIVMIWKMVSAMNEPHGESSLVSSFLICTLFMRSSILTGNSMHCTPPSVSSSPAFIGTGSYGTAGVPFIFAPFFDPRSIYDHSPSSFLFSVPWFLDTLI